MPRAVQACCDPGFRGVIHASFARAGSPVAGVDGPLRQSLHFQGADPQSLARLRSALELACVGVRLVLTGPMADIKAAAAVAADCGLLEEEVTLVGEGSGPVTLFCAHCRTVTTTVEPIGSEAECAGCAIVLSISNHFSRRIAAFLGYAAHAEEAA